MPKRTYNYLGEGNIAIDGPEEILARVERNLEEAPSNNPNYLGIVRVDKGSLVKVKKDKKYPYLWTRTNNSRNLEGVDYMRYDAHVQTVWKKSPREYEIITNQGVDWNGALDCLKKIYYDTKSSKKKTLIHGDLVNISGRGIFIVGECRSGKSTLLMNLLENIGGVFVTGGNTLVENKGDRLTGFYLPRDVYLRFSSIAYSDRMFPSLGDVDSCEATQPIDIEAIQSIIRAKAFHVDAGLNYSRERFAELMGIGKSVDSPINKVIFVEYSNGSPLSLRTISDEEALERLKRREFPKNTSLGEVRHQSEIQPPTKSLIKTNWFVNATPVLLSYHGNSDLTKNVLEDLV